MVFLFNHCPYVKHVESALGVFASEYAAKGLATVGICANDVTNYPDDDAPHLVEQAKRAGFTFPYLVDSDQQVALAYRAACTPDFFLYDAERKLAYRGQFDDTRPKTGQAPTGASLRAAAELVLAGKPVPEPHDPSTGCSIKWKPGTNRPDPPPSGPVSPSSPVRDPHLGRSFAKTAPSWARETAVSPKLSLVAHRRRGRGLRLNRLSV